MDVEVLDARLPGIGEGPYLVIAELESGDVPVKRCGSMTEAILFQFDVERSLVWGGFKRPPMRVEMRGAQ